MDEMDLVTPTPDDTLQKITTWGSTPTNPVFTPKC